MPKSADDYRSEQDKEILANPDYFLIRVYSQDYGWVDSTPFQAKTALERFNNIRNMDKPYRLALVAAKTINKKVFVCPISLKMLEDYAAG